jgi:hypothetical protein
VEEAAKKTPGISEGAMAEKILSAKPLLARLHVLPASEDRYKPPVRMEAAKIVPVAAKSLTGTEGRPEAAVSHVLPQSREM